MTGLPFDAGDRAMLIDQRERSYLITLRTGGEFHFHKGIVRHDDLIGRQEGSIVVSTEGEKVIILRPRYLDFVLKMPRGAQVVYPKDAAAIVLYADIYPGARVLEAGIGSGALTIALLRAVGPEGEVVAFEVREDFAETALANVEAFMGKAENLTINIGSVFEHAPGLRFDRAVLDLPEPWQALEALDASLRPGGMLVAYVPTIIQSQKLTEEVRARRGWGRPWTLEVLVRNWHIEDRSVRPDHRMVGHTGFLTGAQKFAM